MASSKPGAELTGSGAGQHTTRIDPKGGFPHPEYQDVDQTLSIFFGLFLMYEIGFRDGLL